MCYHVTFVFYPFTFLYTALLPTIPQATRAFKDFLSLIYSDLVLHVVLSPSTFRHALPSEDVLSWLVPYPPFGSPIPNVTEADHYTWATVSFGCKYS